MYNPSPSLSPACARRLCWLACLPDIPARAAEECRRRTDPTPREVIAPVVRPSVRRRRRQRARASCLAGSRRCLWERSSFGVNFFSCSQRFFFELRFGFFFSLAHALHALPSIAVGDLPPIAGASVRNFVVVFVHVGLMGRLRPVPFLARSSFFPSLSILLERTTATMLMSLATS